VTNNGTTGMPGFSSRLSQAETDAVVAYVAGKAGGPATTTTTEPGSPPPSGAAVFAESCAACHGPSGGDLVDHTLTDSELTSVISRGVGSMPGYASRLSSDQLAAVVAYLSSLGADASGTTSVGGESGGIDSAALYTRYCSTCHGAHGQGGRSGPIAGTSLSRAELIAVTTDGLGSMPGYSGRMTPEEIEAVAAFVLALGPGTDEVIVAPTVSPGTSTGRLYTQLCATCHGADGKGRGTVAPFSENLDAAGVAAMIVNGGTRMPDYPDLTEESLNALVAHTLLLVNGEPPPADAAVDDGSDAVAAVAPGTNDPTPSLIHDVQTGGSSGLPTSALAVVVLGIVGLAGGVGYTRMRASRSVAQ
jgi:mono/diheme cytochrome c family protein